VKKYYLFAFLFIFFNCVIAQVFKPFAFWSGASPVLTISDGATYSYGSISISVDVDKTFTVTNTGTEGTSAISAVAFGTTAFGYKGGTFPGTGGTCTTSGLEVGQSCTIVVTANYGTVSTQNDTIRLNYRTKTTTIQSTRAITATFINTATQLAWVSPPSFIKINDCQALTVQRQDSVGNPVTTGSATAVTSLLFNNGTAGTFYSNSTCATTITSTSIAAGTNSITIYFRNTTSGQSGILVATAAGMTSASQNVTITAAPTKLYVNASGTMKTNTCSPVPIYSLDLNNFISVVGSTITVNLTTTGSNVFYSDSSCTASITSTTITAGLFLRTVYTQNATIQTATITATDPSATLSTSNKSINFNSSLTWWNASWSKRVRIDINNVDQAAAFTNQPVLVKINSSIINYSDVKAAGEDIRFVASDDVTSLNYEFDRWNNGGTTEIWVRIPSIAASSSAGFFYMYYNNPAAADGQNATGVWTNYWSVWHLGNDPTAAAPQYTDSTGNGRNGSALNSPTRTTGQIGLAVDLNGATDAVDINQDLSTGMGSDTTFSAWMRTTQVGNNTTWMAPGLTGVEQSGGGNDIFFGWIDGGGLIGVTAGNGANAKSNFVVNNNAWRHVTITRNATSGAVVFYINGVANGSATSETGAKTTYFDLLGEIGDTGGSPVNYNGLLDEVRIVNSVRTAAQVMADFKYMMNTHVLYNPVESGP